LILKKENFTKFKISFFILSFFLLLNFSTTGGHPYSIDDVSYFLHTENLALNHSMKIDPNSPSVQTLGVKQAIIQLHQRQYEFQGLQWSDEISSKPFYDPSSLLLPLLTVPLYYLAIATHSNPANVIGFFTNSIILSLTSLMIYLTSFEFFKSQKISFVISLVFATTTFVWSYNTGMMLRPLASLLTILGFYLLVTSRDSPYKPVFGGFFIGLSMMAEVASLIILPGLVIFGTIFLRKNKKQMLLFLLGFLIIIILQGTLNEVRFGSFTDFGFGPFQDIRTHTHTDGIVGYIFSLGWGVIFNSPILVLLPPSVYFAYKKDRMFAILVSYLFLITWIFNGTIVSPLWSGYGGWGPRYFIIILPLLMLSIGFFIQEYSSKKYFKIGFVGLSIFGFFVNLMGKLIWYMYGYSYGWGVLRTHLLPNSWEQLNYNFHYAPITLQILALSSNYVAGLSGISGWGLAPCEYDLFILCKFGLYPFIILLVLLTFTSYLIIKRLQIKNIETNIADQ